MCDEQNSNLGEPLTFDLLNPMQLLNWTAAWVDHRYAVNPWAVRR